MIKNVGAKMKVTNPVYAPPPPNIIECATRKNIMAKLTTAIIPPKIDMGLSNDLGIFMIQILNDNRAILILINCINIVNIDE
jgi:hypothetical protein